MDKKRALAKVFGITKHDRMIVGVPVKAPQLIRLFQDRAKLKMYRGLPKDYAHLMSEEQKQLYRELVKKR